MSVVHGEESGNNSPTSILYKIEDGEKLPKHYKLDYDYGNSTSNEYKHFERKNHKEYRSDMLPDIAEHCKLFRDFEDGSSWLYHNELTGIGMNLLHIETGDSCFLNILKEHKNEYYSYCDEKWKDQLDYFKRKNYMPMSCDNFCPYADKCHHGENILNTARVKNKKIIKLNTNEKYYTLEEATQDLNDQFSVAMEAVDNKIHVIKAQTAIGKTHTYLEYMRRSKRPCKIAVPTNKLKHEVCERAELLGINVMKTPSLTEIMDSLPIEIRNTIQSMYNSGRDKMVMPYIAKAAKDGNLILAKYLEEKKALKNHDGHVITTHQNLLKQDVESLRKYDIIIDEDILKTIAKNSVCISISDLRDVLEDNDSMAFSLKKKLEQTVSYSGTKAYFMSEIAVDYYDNLEASVDIASFFSAQYFYSDGKNIYFYKKHNLMGQKYVIASATASEYVYNAYFGAHSVTFHDCKQAKYAGKLIQHYDKTMSRRCIIDNKNLGNDVYAGISKWFGKKVPIITFKGFLKNEPFHFGNTEGCNSLAGEDIAVVGTPHMAEFMYKLFAFQMGYDISDELHDQEVTHGGYKFKIMTYENDVLRNIQFWMIESELEQAVGRARLLRKNCIVMLYSNFPLPQARLVDVAEGAAACLD